MAGANLVEIKKAVDPDVVAQLEKALAQVRNGEVLGVVIVKRWKDNGTSHEWSGLADNQVRMAGELFIAASAVAQNIDNEREYV